MNAHDVAAVADALRPLIGPLDSAALERSRFHLAAALRRAISDYFRRVPDAAALQLVEYAHQAARRDAGAPSIPSSAPLYWPALDPERFRACGSHAERVRLAGEARDVFVSTWG
jgi:hypothetical protein